MITLLVLCVKEVAVCMKSPQNTFFKFVFRALRVWKDQGLKPTTLKHKITSVLDFLTWIGRIWPSGVRISQRKLGGLMEELRRELRRLRADVTSHRVNYQRKKSGKALNICFILLYLNAFSSIPLIKVSLSLFYSILHSRQNPHPRCSQDLDKEIQLKHCEIFQ